MTPTLWVLAPSPWSERARWALRHHRVGFVERKHLPMLGEPLLRWRAGSSRATVPLLLEADARTMGSLEIARRSEALGAGAAPTLFPEGRAADLDALSAIVERVSSAGRALVLRRVGADDDAARAELPRALRGLPFGAASAKLATRFLARKYPADVATATDALRAGLLALRAALDGRATLLGEFSYADILAATSLQFVEPVAQKYLPLAPASRRAWTHPELAEEFTDLVRWRDALYSAHRPIA